MTKQVVKVIVKVVVGRRAMGPDASVISQSSSESGLGGPNLCWMDRYVVVVPMELLTLLL